MLVTHHQLSRRLPGDLVRVLLVAVAYFLAGEAGLQLALVGGQVTPLWPCTGIALVCLLWFGLRIWPGIALGALLINVTLGPSAWGVAAIIAGNTVAPVAAFLLLRLIGFRTELDRLKDALALIFLGGLAGMLISATTGAATLVLAGAIPTGAFWPTWSVWWAGDAMGVLIVAPVLLALRAPRSAWAGIARRLPEAAAVTAGAVALTLVVMSTFTPMLFLVFPFLIWAALRFQLIGAAPCALAVSVIASLTAAEQTGPFLGLGLTPTMITLLAFNGAIALTALLLSAITSERNAAQQAVEDTCRVLAEAVTKLGGNPTLEETTLKAVSRARIAPSD